MIKEEKNIGKMPVDEVLKEFNSSVEGLSSEEAQARLKEYGLNQLEEKKVNPVLSFLSYFWGPIPWMIEVAAVLSMILSHWVDFSIIVFLLAFNSLIGFFQEHQASNAIEALKKNLALKARAKRDGKWQEIEASNLVPGDVIKLILGDVIPADIKFINGDYLSVDQSALTGESLPVDKKIGDVGYSGCAVKQGEMEAIVTITGGDTYFGKTAKLVAKTKVKSHFQQAVLRVGNFLIFTAITLVVLLVGVEIARHAPLGQLVEFALILTIASIPVAMPAVLSVTMALGALALSKMKAVVSKLESIEEMAGMDILCSDKTGTLTQNKLTLQDPIPFGDEEAQNVILFGALSSKQESQSAIDAAVINGLKDKSILSDFEKLKFIPFDPVSKRTEAVVRDKKTSKKFKVTMGAPQVIVDMCELSDEEKNEVDKKIEELASKGIRTLGVSKADETGKWKFSGMLPLLDPPRSDSDQTIRQAKEHGIKVKMITGDNIAIAKEISAELGLDTNIYRAPEIFKSEKDQEHFSKDAIQQVERAGGFAEVFPEHKYDIVKALQEGGHIVGMTGDGVNDAPALKAADTGIAVSGATDAARAAASLILTAPGLSVIINAIEEARKIFERMNSYVIYRIAMTLSIMLFVVASMITFGFYPLTAVALILLSLMDDIPIMTIAYDNTWLDPKPVRWRMGRVISVSTVLGIMSLIESFGMLLITLKWIGLSLPMIETAMFLQLVAAGHLLLFVTRTKKHFWTRPGPASPLFWAIIGTQIVAVLFSGFGILMSGIPWYLIGIIWLYNGAWMFLNDFVKIFVYYFMDHKIAHNKHLHHGKKAIHNPINKLGHQREG